MKLSFHYSSVERHSGQALLVIVLIMAVVLTIALSIASRTISDLNISTREDDSARAFSAAEAGIEQSLLRGSGAFTLQGNVTSQDSFTATTSLLVSGGNQFSLPILMAAGETASVWLVEHDANGALLCSSGEPCFTGSQIQVCWGQNGTDANSPTTPALEAAILYTTSDTDFATARIARAAFDPNLSRLSSNNFVIAEGECTVESTTYAFSKTIDLASLGVNPIRPSSDVRRGPQYIRLRLLYNTNQAHPTGLAVVGAGTFPVQGNKVIATGTSGTATRSLEVYQLFSDLPPIFNYALFSGSGGIVK